ncbi:MAG: DUF559 domain-containing protein [Chloroflexi bacterium]|nr:DUF559 domain-containing protein [Chloroflexota bacterium]
MSPGIRGFLAMHRIVLFIGLIGLVFSLIAPGWGLALIFGVLLIYLWTLTPTPLDAPPPPVASKRSPEPEGYRSIEWKGLIFRSESEIKIAKTLDHRGIFFIPPVRVRLNAGKKSRQSRELDFVICHEGKWGILEVDGPFHVREADAERDQWLAAHGIQNVQRFPSLRCFQEPQGVVDEFLHHLEHAG